MTDTNTLEILVRLFQDQRSVTHNLWTMYAITTFTAAAFSFKNHARMPIAIFVAIGYMAFALGHLTLVIQSIESTNALADAIVSYSTEDAFSAASLKVASTANLPRVSVVAHLVIDLCVCVLVIFGRGKQE